MLAISAYEIAQNIPQGYINYAISRSFPNGAWSRLERNEVALDAAFFAEFTSDLMREDVWRGYCEKLERENAEGKWKGSAVPKIDGEWLFWDMMRVSREMDPYMSVAIRRLRELEIESGGARGNAKRLRRKFTLGALTNDYKFPEDHPYSTSPEHLNSLKSLFDVWISSSVIGMRKPERRIYEYAVQELGGKRKEVLGVEGQENALRPEEIVFLDDIGMNLKGAAGVGMRGIRVLMGETWRAVKELEELLGLKEGTLYDEGVVERLKRDGEWDGTGGKGSKL